MYTAVDLFSGAGGLSQGLVEARFDVLGAVEIDPLACAAYSMNHGKVELWDDDIGEVTGPTILRGIGLKRGELDLLAACPPCQGFSRLRTRNGKRRNRDQRNDLIFDVLRIIRSTSPKCLMLENVPGLASSKQFRKFCDAIRALGYKPRSAVLNAARFGVPQRRRRLVLIASRLSEPKFAPEAKVVRTVQDSIGKLPTPDESDDPLHNYSVERSDKVQKIIGRIPHDGGSRRALGPRSQLECHKRHHGFHDVYGRMAWNQPAPTITGGCINPSKGRFLHPQQDRAITLREAALLQTFPKDYQFPIEGGRYPVALLIGNALPPEFIRRHASALRRSGLNAK